LSSPTILMRLDPGNQGNGHLLELRGQRAPGCLLVIEDETEVAARICALIPFLPA